MVRVVLALVAVVLVCGFSIVPALAGLTKDDPLPTGAASEVGSLQVTLSVSGTPDAAASKGYPFVVQVTCSGGSGSRSLTFASPAAPSQLITDIPTGSTCTATETTRGGADDVTVDPSAGVTIATGATGLLTVTNNFTAAAEPEPTPTPTPTPHDTTTTTTTRSGSTDGSTTTTTTTTTTNGSSAKQTTTFGVQSARPSDEQDNSPSIQVTKKVTPGSDTSRSFHFVLTGDHGGTTDLHDGQSQTWQHLDAGSTYQLAEVIPTGWALDNVSCTPGSDTTNTNPARITLGHRDPWDVHDFFDVTHDSRHPHVECTFTNKQAGATFNVRKSFSDHNPADVGVSLACTSGTVTNDDTSASESDPANFTVHGFASPDTSMCTATEVARAGYTGSGSPPGTCSATIAAGVCTITNTLNTATIQVIKKVDNHQAADWNIIASPPAAPMTVTPGQVTTTLPGAPSFALKAVPTGGAPVHLAEVPQPGYTAGSTTCTRSGSAPQTSPNGQVDVTVRPGETWLCTFSTSTNAATIQVVKQIDGHAVSGWLIDAATPPSPATVSPPQVTTRGWGTADFKVATVGSEGSRVHLGEEPQDGYSAGGVVCARVGSAAQRSTTNGRIDVTVRPGETWLCTFTNTVNTATIHVRKLVDGEVRGGWTISASTPSPSGRVEPSSVVTGDHEHDRFPSEHSDFEHFQLDHVANAGSTTTLTEAPKDGYSFVAVSCTSGAGNQTGAAGSIDVTVKPGETWWCTFSNKVSTGTIRVTKLVDGTQQDGWMVRASSPTPRGDVQPSSQITRHDEPVRFHLEHVANAGSTSTLTETPKDGYSFVGATCTSGAKTQSGAAGSVSVTVLPGETWDCTFSNTVSRGTIRVRKVIGGQQQGGWTVGASPPAPSGGITPSIRTTSADDWVSFALDHVVTAGSRTTLTETSQDGFSFDAVLCTSAGHNAQSGPAGSADVDVTVKPGETWDCTFTNTVNTGTIRVRKVVDGQQQGGWTVGASPPTPSGEIDSTSRVTSSDDWAAFTLNHVSKNGSTTTLTEAAQEGFSFASLECTSPGHDARTGHAGSVAVTVTPNETWDCTFANTTNTATIQVASNVDGAQAAGWTVDASGPSSPMTVLPGQVTTASPGAPTFALTKVSAGGSYVHLVEEPRTGFTLGTASCSRAGSSPQSSTVNGQLDVTVQPGETWACTFDASVNVATFSVTSSFSDGNGAATPVSLTCTSGTVVTSPLASSPSNPATFTVRGFSSAAGTSCTATGGSVPAGYTSSGPCSTSLAAGGCTITYAVSTAPFTVSRTFSDRNPIAVPVSLVCTSGGVTTTRGAASGSSPATFSVDGYSSKAGTTCTATEFPVPNGYTSTGPCSANLAAGGCTIANTLNTAPFTVAASFSDHNPASVPVSLSCTTGAPASSSASASEASPAGFTVDGFTTQVGTTCTAQETSVPTGYTSSGSCSASIATGGCTITNTAVIPVQVKGITAVRLISNVRRHALVAGETVRLVGKAPPGCDPLLRVDGLFIERAATARDGSFDISIGTKDLAAGRHVAEVVCTHPSAVLLRKTFWIAAPVGSSNIILVALASLLVLFAIGWVGLRTLAGVGAASQAAKP